MNKIKYSIIALSIFSLVIIFGNIANAESQETVSATVSAKNIALTVTDRTIVYGSVTIGSTNNTTTNGMDNSQTVTNTGNVIEDFKIKGQDSIAWPIGASAGDGIYAHGVCISDCDASPSWIALSVDYSELTTDIAIDGTLIFDLQIYTPTATSNYDEQSVNVMVLALEHED